MPIWNSSIVRDYFQKEYINKRSRFGYASVVERAILKKKHGTKGLSITKRKARKWIDWSDYLLDVVVAYLLIKLVYSATRLTPSEARKPKDQWQRVYPELTERGQAKNSEKKGISEKNALPTG